MLESVLECQGVQRSTEQCQYVRVPKIAGICQDVLNCVWESPGVLGSAKKCQGVLRSVKECGVFGSARECQGVLSSASTSDCQR